ncbi:unnamed protein product, partial [Polarella glacialis]
RSPEVALELPLQLRKEEPPAIKAQASGEETKRSDGNGSSFSFNASAKEFTFNPTAATFTPTNASSSKPAVPAAVPADAAKQEPKREQQVSSGSGSKPLSQIPPQRELASRAP